MSDLVFVRTDSNLFFLLTHTDFLLNDGQYLYIPLHYYTPKIIKIIVK